VSAQVQAERIPGIQPAVLAPAGLGLALLVLGLAGVIGAGAGYGLFIVAGLLLAAGIVAFGLFALTRRFDGEALLGSARWLLLLGGWTYVLTVAALSGHYAREALAGRIDLKWILFGPAILAALIVLDFGLYAILVRKQLPTWRRYRHVISRDNMDPAAMRRTLIDEVVLHRTLFSVSGFRWLRHTLIFWGFMLMFGVELVAVIFREALPAFGATNTYADFAHPLRAGFEFAFDLTGLMVLVGCVLALYWRVRVNGTALQKYTDTPTTLFLLAVVITGFAVEGWRIAAMHRDATLAVSFVGYGFSFLFPAGIATETASFNAFWLLHVLGSCAFIAYVPVWRLIHSCATPLGRLMNSQTQMLAKKKASSLQGLLARRQLP
jgi:hypothetical protein